MKQTSTDSFPLVCPFTQRALQQLSDKELEVINSKIDQGQLLFHSGSPVNLPIRKAYSTSQYLHVYPVIDGVLFLKKETAIVAKNRVQNPHHRRSNEELDAFYQSYALGSFELSEYKSERSLELPALTQLRDYLPKALELVVTYGSGSADDVLNLLYQKGARTHIHCDSDYQRLSHVVQDLPDSTIACLIDLEHLPFKAQRMDALHYIGRPEMDMKMCVGC